MLPSTLVVCRNIRFWTRSREIIFSMFLSDSHVRLACGVGNGVIRSLALLCLGENDELAIGLVATDMTDYQGGSMSR